MFEEEILGNILVDTRKRATIKTISISIVVIVIYFASRFIGNAFLGLEISDTTAIFLALIPLVVYLIFSGAITEFKGGGIEVKFREAANSKVMFKQEDQKKPVLFDRQGMRVKGGYEDLKSLVRAAAEDKSTVLGLVAGYEYSESMLKEYLEALSVFEHARYVVFSDKYGRFRGFATTSSLIASLRLEHELVNIINLIAKDDLKAIPSFVPDSITEFASNQEALRILEEKNLPDIAVINSSGEFCGFANKNAILYSILKKSLH